LAVAAEGGDALQVAVGLGDGHDRTVAVDGMAAGGEVPFAAFGGALDLSDGMANGLRGLGGRQAKEQG
jgi:hypothetical protein